MEAGGEEPAATADDGARPAAGREAAPTDEAELGAPGGALPVPAVDPVPPTTSEEERCADDRSSRSIASAEHPEHTCAHAERCADDRSNRSIASVEHPEHTCAHAALAKVARGALVEVVGLERSADLNGSIGRIGGHDEASDTYVVHFASGRPSKARLRRQNFQAAPEGAAEKAQAEAPPPREAADAGLAPGQAMVPVTTTFGLGQTHQEEAQSSCPGLVSVVHTYAAVTKRCPVALIVLYLVLLVALIAGGWRTFELDEEFSSFVNADGQAMRNREAYLLALQEMGDSADGRRLLGVGGDAGAARRAPRTEAARAGGGAARAEGAEAAAATAANGSSAHRRLSQAYSMNWLRRSVTIYYVSRDGNTFSERALRDQRDFEAELRNGTRWQNYCREKVVAEAERWMCDPGESFAALAYPSQGSATSAHEDFKLAYDGRGTDLMSLRAVFAQMQDGLENGNDKSREIIRYFPKSFEMPDVLNTDSEIEKTIAIRTTFTWYIYFGSLSDSVSEQRDGKQKENEEYEEFLVDYIYPILQQASDKYSNVHIYYTGDLIKSHEIRITLWSDILLAIGSIIFVTIFMWVHMRSLLLALGGFFIIFSSVPVAYVLTPVAKTTVASFLSLFLVTVIDIDVIFVFVDMWEQSSRMKNPTIEGRLVEMIMRAGKSTLATSLTTSLSFFANLASALQPLREFGLFMGLSVMSVYFLALLFMPPLVVLRERCADEANRRKIMTRTIDISLGQMTTLEVSSWGPCSFLCGPIDKDKPRLVNSLLAKLVDSIAGCSCALLCLTFLCLPVFFWGIATQITVDTGIPEIFPEGHNQAEVLKYAPDFDAADDLSVWIGNVERGGSVCKLDVFGSRSPPGEGCVLNWCELDAEEQPPAVDEALCFQATARAGAGGAWDVTPGHGGYDGCDTVEVVSRLVAAEASWPTSEAASTAWLQESGALTTFAPGLEGLYELDVSESRFITERPMGFQDWQAGSVHMTSLAKSSVKACPSLVDKEDDDPYTSLDDKVCPYALPATPTGNDEVQNVSSRHCEIHTVCFAGTRVCKMPDNWALANFTLNLSAAVGGSSERLLLAPDAASDPVDAVRRPSGGRVGSRPRRAAVGRQLSDFEWYNWDVYMVPSMQSRPTDSWYPMYPGNFDVTLVYGIRPARSTPLVGKWPEYWSFDTTFEPSNPWAQRAVLNMCTNAFLTYDLFVLDPDAYPSEVYCWAWYFRQWLNEGNGAGSFPSRDFDADFKTFYDQYDSITTDVKKDIWMDDGKMKACKMSMHVDLSRDMTKEAGLSYMSKWDAFVESENAKAHMTANKAWHTAQVWVSAEAHDAIISGTTSTILIELLCSFTGLIIFTGDLILAVLVLTLVIINISGLAFFMISIMKWAIGPIEVICLVVFVGFSVTYSLHIAHNFSRIREGDSLYKEALQKIRRRQQRRASKQKAQKRGDPALGAPEDQDEPWTPTPFDCRVARTRVAMMRVGGAVLSSTVSTIGGSVFLLFCTLTIFLKLGAVIMCVTTLSVFYTVVSLPAVLIRFGPSGDPCYKRAPRRMWRALTGSAVQPRADEEPLMQVPMDDLDILY